MSAHIFTRSDSRGHVHILLSLVVIAVVAVMTVVAFRIHHRQVVSPSTSSSTSAKIPTAITSKADVTQAAQALQNDQTASQLDPSQLNDDLNSLL